MTGAGEPRFELLGAGDALAAAAAAPGCFQHPGWVQAAAAARGRPHRLQAVRARWRDGRTALLVGALHRRFGVPVFESMPLGGYGGWFGDAALTVDDECRLNRAWLSRARWPLLVLTSAPGCGAALPDAATLRWAPAGWRARLAPHSFSTHLLDLGCDDPTLVRRVTPKMRGYLRRFDQLGFEIAVQRGEPALRTMHRWYRQGSQGWMRPGGSLLPEGFFTALADDAGTEVWTVRHGGTEIGAALFLVGRHEVQYQASGTQRIESPLSGMEAVLWAAARHYRDRGLATMNLGASEGLASVARFKEKFGAVVAPYRRVTYLLPGLWRSTAAAGTAGPR